MKLLKRILPVYLLLMLNSNAFAQPSLSKMKRVIDNRNIV
jgi:hypothetical protein